MNKNIRLLSPDKLINGLIQDFLVTLLKLTVSYEERAIVSLFLGSFAENKLKNTPDSILERLEEFFPESTAFISMLMQMINKVEEFIIENDGFNRVKSGIKSCELFQIDKREFFLKLIYGA